MSLDKNRAWKLLEDISFVRVAGTDEELKAAGLETEEVSPLLLPKYARHER